MEIKITLDSPAIQERFDQGGIEEINKILNEELGFNFGFTGTNGGDVLDENGNVAGKWEVRA